MDLSFETLSIGAIVLCCCVAIGAATVSLVGTRRSAVTSVLRNGVFLAMLTGMSLGLTATRHDLPQIAADVVLLVLTLAAVATTVRLVRLLPRAIAFSDRKHLRSASRELRSSKERFQRAIDGALCAMWEWNIESGTLWLSNAFCTVSDFDAGADCARTMEGWKSQLHPADSEALQESIANSLVSHGPVDVEIRQRTKSGEYRWFYLRCLAIRDPCGKAYLISGSIQDIHRRKLAEECIHRRDDYLAQKQKMESLGELAGGAAHEFNNLLQAISGQIQFAQRLLPRKSQASQELEIASDLIDHSSKFTRQLLDFSRRHPRTREMLDLNDSIRRLAVVIRPLLGAAIDLRLHLGNRVRPVLADAAAIQQVVLNLCINARDAMPQGGQLVIRTCPAEFGPHELAKYPDAKPGHYTMVSISDSGKGIPESDREKLFQPFFTTKPDGAGTGLGLAIVYAAIKDFGGVIDVESAEGHGTTISFWLPLAKRSGKNPSKKIVSSRARPGAGRATLLYVEDDAHTRRVTSESLAARGCNVLAAANGLEAIDLFERHRDKIDLAILDIVLPKLGGDEVIKQIRHRHAELPVVICSGYIGQLVDPDLLKSPNTWLINKPYKMDELVETLENALGSCEISTAVGV